ncbi:hypothetical protein AB9F29_03855 [Falsihalocynthiibacter sp. S25ZX9]|uniref:hypothetical protein n=1 Tax=Falsihalocynthiibacter sp. S25ZX9 TaxID=3240870 RepID=UPI00350F46F0
MSPLVWILVAAVFGILFFGMKRTSRKNNNPLFQALESELMNVVIEGGNTLNENTLSKIKSILIKYDLATMDVIHVTTMMDIQLARLAYSKPQIQEISNAILELDAERRT